MVFFAFFQRFCAVLVHCSPREDFVKQNTDKEKIIDIPYITYKAESTLIEESQQLKFAIALKELGYQLNILDKRKEVIKQIESLL